MNTDDKNEDADVKRVLSYLSGDMDDTERRTFDKELANNSDLRELLTDFQFVETGAAILDKIESDHISSELLLEYSENRQSLDNKDITAIEKHLQLCGQCREDLEFCRHDLPSGQESKATGFWESLFSAFGYLFKPRLVLRPVYGLALLLAIIIPAFIFYSGGDLEKGYISSFNIQPGTRDIGTANDIVVSPTDRFVELNFTIPVMDDRHYVISLLNGDSLLVMTKYEYDPDELFEIDIPLSYLSEGKNYLVVGEFEGDIEQDRYNFIFSVSYLE